MRDDTYRDVFKEYRQHRISWDEAYAISNNSAATAIATDEVEWWTKQMESLAVDCAEIMMKNFLGYIEDDEGILSKPNALLQE